MLAGGGVRYAFDIPNPSYCRLSFDLGRSPKFSCRVSLHRLVPRRPPLSVPRWLRTFSRTNPIVAWSLSSPFCVYGSLELPSHAGPPNGDSPETRTVGVKQHDASVRGKFACPLTGG